jgi:hypothetical protein
VGRDLQSHVDINCACTDGFMAIMIVRGFQLMFGDSGIQITLQMIVMVCSSGDSCKV